MTDLAAEVATLREQRDRLLSACEGLLANRPDDANDHHRAAWVDLDYVPTGGDGSGNRDRWMLTPSDIAERVARRAIAFARAERPAPAAPHLDIHDTREEVSPQFDGPSLDVATGRGVG